MPLYRRIDNVYSLDPLSTQTKSTFHPLHRYASPTPPNKDYGNYNVYGSFTNHPKGRHMSVQSHPEGRGIATYIGHPLTRIGSKHPLIGDCRRGSYTLFGVLRHRTPSSPIYPSEVVHKPFASSRVFLLFSGRKSIVLVKEKAPLCSGFPLSLYVVLKTTYANPKDYVRRY